MKVLQGAVGPPPAKLTAGREGRKEETGAGEEIPCCVGTPLRPSAGGASISGQRRQDLAPVSAGP